MNSTTRDAARARASTRARWVAFAFALVAASAASAQSALGHPPNLRADWELERWRTYFVFAHRFEFIQGGDELINLPTLTLATGLGGRLALGLDYTSNSEIVPDKLGGNEVQLWLNAGQFRAGPLRVAAMLGRNTAARSTDGAITTGARLGPVSLIAEGRAFSSAFGTGDAGSAVAGGVVAHLTPRLELSADVARMMGHDSLRSVWSAGAAIAIPGSPHTLSLHATNGGALTLQAASRPRVLGRESVRYGFTFSLPIGSRGQWARVFQRDPPDTPDTTAGQVAARIEMRLIAYTPREVRVRAGQSVEWVNRDPLQHTATADDGSWGSRLLDEGQRYRRTFTVPGRYTYHCTPHPQMRGVIIVEPSGS